MTADGRNWAWEIVASDLGLIEDEIVDLRFEDPTSSRLLGRFEDDIADLRFEVP